MMNRILIILSLCLFSFNAIAASSSVYQKSAAVPLNEAYDLVYQELEQRNFFVVFEANIGKNISRFEKKWAEDYNQNKLTGIRSMVFCNGWYANKVSNADPVMLALCPMRLTVIEKDGNTSVLFVKPTHTGQGSAALPILQEIESTVIEAIDAAME
jgi:uncharacterized protein (DUF302 family)